MSWEVRQTKRFVRAYRKLHPNQLAEVNRAIQVLAGNPLLGEPKKGDLSKLRVYKFSCLGQQLLLGYTMEKRVCLIYLEALGPHENFYRDVSL